MTQEWVLWSINIIFTFLRNKHHQFTQIFTFEIFYKIKQLHQNIIMVSHFTGLPKLIKITQCQNQNVSNYKFLVNSNCYFKTSGDFGYDKKETTKIKIMTKFLRKRGQYVLINTFVSSAAFLYPLKTSENLMVFWCLQGVEKGCIGKKWVKM